MPEYDNLQSPLEFRKKFEELNKKHNLGYVTFPEFTKDDMRRRFEEIMSIYNAEEGRTHG